MLLDRYIFREWLKAFLMALGATAGILLLERIQNSLKDFLDWGASGGDILRYYLFLFPSFLPTVIPISLLVSLLFVLGNLHRNMEITAMRAGGMHLFRITRSLWLAGLLLSGLLFYLNAEMVPRYVELSRTIQENLRFAGEARYLDEHQVGVVPYLSLDNGKDRRIWFMNRFSEYTYEAFGVNVYQRDENGREIYRVMAREGFYDDVAGEWVLVEGRELTFAPGTGEVIRSLPFDKKRFPQFDEHPGMMLTLQKRVDQLSLREIRDLLGKVSPEENPKMLAYRVREMNLLSSPFVCLIVVGLAIPFAVSGVRTNPMVGASKSVFLFFVYYLIANLTSLLGSQGVLSPMVAAWIPLILMALFAFYLLRRVS